MVALSNETKITFRAEPELAKAIRAVWRLPLHCRTRQLLAEHKLEANISGICNALILLNCRADLLADYMRLQFPGTAK